MALSSAGMCACSHCGPNATFSRVKAPGEGMHTLARSLVGLWGPEPSDSNSYTNSRPRHGDRDTGTRFFGCSFRMPKRHLLLLGPERSGQPGTVVYTVLLVPGPAASRASVLPALTSESDRCSVAWIGGRLLGAATHLCSLICRAILPLLTAGTPHLVHVALLHLPCEEPCVCGGGILRIAQGCDWLVYCGDVYGMGFSEFWRFLVVVEGCGWWGILSRAVLWGGAGGGYELPKAPAMLENPYTIRSK